MSDLKMWLKIMWLYNYRLEVTMKYLENLGTGHESSMFTDPSDYNQIYVQVY